MTTLQQAYKKLGSAAENGDLALVKKFVSTRKKHFLDFQIALLGATIHGHLPIVKYLMENIEYLDEYYNQTLATAKIRHHTDIVDYLKEWKKSSNKKN